MTAILMTAFCCLALGGGPGFMIGINASGFAYGTAGVTMECMISRHWSAGGEISVGFGKLAEGMPAPEREHRQEFGEETQGPAIDNHTKESIYARYWPKTALNGFYLMGGISSGNISGADFCIGAGWLMRIHRRIHIYTEYRLDLHETVKAAKLPVKGISAGICITLGKQEGS